MANKNRSVYNVDEDALKRMVAGDTTALEKIRKQDERPEEDAGASGVSEEKEKKPDVSIEKKPFAGKKTPRAYGFDDYREQFLQHKLTGARRQTYIHDSLYKVLARVLPVIAPEMSVPTFVNSVLSDHLKRYQDIINGMYNREATQKPVEWEL